MALNGKKKGNRGELELTKILDERFGKGKFKRVPQSGAFTGGSNRAKTENISEEAKNVLSGDLITPKGFRFSIEHKSYGEISFWDLFNSSSKLLEWMKQAEGDAIFAKKSPLLVVKINRHERLAFIKLDIGEEYFFESKGWYCYYLNKLLEITPDELWLEKIE